MTKVWVAEVSIPPLAIPPLSLKFKLIVARPIAAPADVKISCHQDLIAGGTLNKPVLSFPTT
ncbi:hypothetical protein QUA27_02390 [Microcoleus sp. Pol14C6]|uniref:hypothetical protein n=1 Tax=unclassified Microcoleus TaxID=2642155 RepID=UPI002FD3519A